MDSNEEIFKFINIKDSDYIEALSLFVMTLIKTINKLYLNFSFGKKNLFTSELHLLNF